MKEFERYFIFEPMWQRLKNFADVIPFKSITYADNPLWSVGDLAYQRMKIPYTVNVILAIVTGGDEK